MMKQSRILLSIAFGLFLIGQLYAQDITIVSAKMEADYFLTKAKFSRNVDYQAEPVFEMKSASGKLHYGCIVYAYENFNAGATYDVAMQSSGSDIAPTTKVSKVGSTALLQAADRFKASFSTAFVDGDIYSAYHNGPVTGSVKKGDKVTCKDEDNRTFQVEITGISLQPASGSEISLNGIDERFEIGNGFSILFTFKSSINRGPGGKFTFSALSGDVATQEVTAAKTFKGEREIMPKNVTLTDGKLKITLNNLVKYAPKQADSPVFKVDETIDYYILDVTIENVSGEIVDAGDYVIHLNLYDAAGVNSDDHGRLFKETNSEAKGEIDAADKQIFGGTSSLRYATILTLYSENDPADTQVDYDAVWGKLQPGQKVHCTALKAIGVPKTYKPTEIGFWLTDVKKPVKAKL